MELMYTGGQGKQTRLLTMMEKYMCLPDIHEVYSALFSIIQIRSGTREFFNCQVFILLCGIGYKTTKQYSCVQHST